MTQRPISLLDWPRRSLLSNTHADLERWATYFDGADMYCATLFEGTLGAPRHGDPLRWDWGYTAATLQGAMQRTARLERIAASLTPDQKAALWADDSEQARVLRRYGR